MRFTSLVSSLLLALTLLSANPARAAVITFDDSNFGLNPTFSNVVTFDFQIDLAATLTPGGFFDPVLDGVDYNVFGALAPGTPSGFPAFNLVRTITGTDFYAQGSSLTFEISPTADLSDGLQVSELIGADPVFVFNGREVGTGRYHPSLVELNSDGTGLIRNSNNFGGINPGSGEMVDVQIGEEYITELSFNPNTLTLAASAVPEPQTWVMCVIAVGWLVRRHRRTRRQRRGDKHE